MLGHPAQRKGVIVGVSLAFLITTALLPVGLATLTQEAVAVRCSSDFAYQTNGGSFGIGDSWIGVTVQMWVHYVYVHPYCRPQYHYMVMATNPYWSINPTSQLSDTYVNWKTQLPSWSTVSNIGSLNNNGCANTPLVEGGQGQTWETIHGVGFGYYCGYTGTITVTGLRTNIWYSGQFGQPYNVVVTLTDISPNHNSISNTIPMTS